MVHCLAFAVDAICPQQICAHQLLLSLTYRFRLPTLLIGSHMIDRDFLKHMAKSDAHATHGSGEACGHCHLLFLGAEVAREMLAANDVGAGAIGRWVTEQDRRWRSSKLVRLWTEEEAAGRDPREAFAACGWEP